MRFRIGFVACSNKADYKDSSLPVETRVQDLFGSYDGRRKGCSTGYAVGKRNCQTKILYPMNS